jgi:putative membrane protein
MNEQPEINMSKIVRGAVAGLIGGLVASYVMNQFQSLWSKILPSAEEQSKSEWDEPSTVKAAEKISEGVLDHKLTDGEKDLAGPLVHYAMGGGSGAIYGAVSEVIPTARVGAGVPFGAAVWLAADELAVPALGLARSPTETPLSTHTYALASHFVYGLATEAVRGAIRRVL